MHEVHAVRMDAIEEQTMVHRIGSVIVRTGPDHLPASVDRCVVHLSSSILRRPASSDKH
ncbi:MAG: hypothetical protein JST66_02680 [Bacteroidetes bacterium]|nr:hypothetical protein [Bacteroidota bacterium]